jgi:hypothetical protein
VLGVGLADAMRQTTMTQCYSPPSGRSAVARMPGGDAGRGRETNFLTTSPPPVAVPPGYHYYQMHGTAYFLKLSTGEKVNLGPVAVTPAKIKKERATVKIEPVSPQFGVSRKRAAVELLDPSATKKSRSVAGEDIEVVEILTDDDDDDESVRKTCDLPDTCDFTFPEKVLTPSAKSEDSDGGETVLGSPQEEDLLLSDS